MKHILAIGGKAQSGKSSTVKILRSLGVPVVSTSELLDEFLTRLKIHYGIDQGSTVEETRQLKIKAAERVLVPTFGREVFANTAARMIFKHPESMVAIETIGGEEWKLIQKAITLEAAYSETSYTIRRYNLIRDSQLENVDIRELLENARLIKNNGTLDDLYDYWLLEVLHASTERNL